MNDCFVYPFMHPMVAVVGFPLLAGLVCLALPKPWERLSAAIGVAGAALTLLLVWQMFLGRATLPAGRWLRLDPLSGFVLLAVAVFGLLIAIYSVGYMRGRGQQREYYGYLLWTVSASLGTVLANDLFLLLIGWGFLGLMLYLMVGLSGAPASGAAKKSFIIVGGSDCFLMLGIAIVVALTGQTRMDQTPLLLTGQFAYVAFLCFAVAAFAKAGAMPFHTWVPDCGETAYASVTAFLPASLDKLLGIYLLARAARELFVLNLAMNTLLMIVGAVTVISAVMMALVQHDLKKLLSYHAVSQVGYMVLGIGTGTAVGVAGGLFHMLNNAIYKSGLFLCAGAVEQKAGGTDLDRLGGLARALPLTFGTCVVCALSISGIPPLNGFVSKWMVYQGILETGQNGAGVWVLWLAAAMLGSALTMASFVKVLHAGFLCKPSRELAVRPPREVGVSMALPMVVLAAICVLFGVLAYRLPLRQLILPVMDAMGQPVAYPGVWWGGAATVMLLVAFAVGLLIYFLTTARTVRVCETYIGGEDLNEAARRTGAPAAAAEGEVTGADFYRTIEELPILGGFYRAADRKLFDVYEVGKQATSVISRALQVFHTGVLRSYVTWYVVGLLILLWALR